MSSNYDTVVDIVYAPSRKTRTYTHPALVLWGRVQGTSSDSFGVKLFDGHPQGQIFCEYIRGPYPVVGRLYMLRRTMAADWPTYTFTPTERVP